eukprot:TRINITY_DN12826_c0_g1_i1.p1 TRINITY_DN12826_c0_g1~~TRINITY_DN12826_c0_g1_i1.p1  ORF type:complete len:251 (+),score=34.86 TRINITY_DN12826_c0_g1_i1:33-785(+)
MAITKVLLVLLALVGTLLADDDKKKKDPTRTLKKMIKLLRYADAATCTTKIQKLLSRDASGTVGDLGTFSGPKLVAEYFCQARVKLPGFVSFVDGTFSVRSATVDSKARIIWAQMRADIQINGWPSGGIFDFPLSVQLKFNEKGKLQSFSAAVFQLTSFLTWQSTQGSAYMASLLARAPTSADFINSYCTTIQGLCTGINQQYADVAACESAMGALPAFSLPLYFSNSVSCRANHIPMAALHCPRRCLFK